MGYAECFTVDVLPSPGTGRPNWEGGPHPVAVKGHRMSPPSTASRSSTGSTSSSGSSTSPPQSDLQNRGVRDVAGVQLHGLSAARGMPRGKDDLGLNGEVPSRING